MARAPRTASVNPKWTSAASNFPPARLTFTGANLLGSEPQKGSEPPAPDERGRSWSVGEAAEAGHRRAAHAVGAERDSAGPRFAAHRGVRPINRSASRADQLRRRQLLARAQAGRRQRRPGD